MSKDMVSREQRIQKRKAAEAALRLRIAWNKPLDQIVQALEVAKLHGLLQASDLNLMQAAKLIMDNMNREG